MNMSKIWKKLDLLHVQGESLAVWQVLSTLKVVEQEDWRSHSIFCTKLSCGEKVCDVIVDNSSMENTELKGTVEKLKIAI